MDPANLIQLSSKLWGDGRMLNSYFADGQMAVILQELEYPDLQASILALGAARKSTRPTREVEEAIGHLRSAVVRCLAAARKRRFLGLLKATGQARYKAYSVAFEASLISALCYRYLLDTRQASEHLHNAMSYFDDYAKAKLDTAKEDARASSLEATMSDSSDAGSELAEQFDRIDRTKANIEAERKYLKELMAVASKTDDALPSQASLSFARTSLDHLPEKVPQA